jgi:hypothetical protein
MGPQGSSYQSPGQVLNLKIVLGKVQKYCTCVMKRVPLSFNIYMLFVETERGMVLIMKLGVYMHMRYVIYAYIYTLYNYIIVHTYTHPYAKPHRSNRRKRWQENDRKK